MTAPKSHMKKQYTIHTQTKIWDVVVIGGGPAGMMSAGKAGERGLKVLVLEKNNTFGKKLLLTGGGRCNITNNKQNVREMLERYTESGKFLFSTFSQHAVQDTILFFKKLGVELAEENEGRLFPVTNSSETVRDALLTYIQKNNVYVQTNSAVTHVTSNADTGLFEIDVANSKSIQTRACIIAAGGTSHPETGSTGECFSWLQNLGHKTSQNKSALVPVATKEAWSKKLLGLTLPLCKLTLYVNNKKHSAQKGKLLFTHFGLSGPLVLNMSKTIGEMLTKGSVTLHIDVLPTDTEESLRAKLQTLLTIESNKKIKNVLHELVPVSLVLPILSLAQTDGETPNHSVRSEERKKLVSIIKALPLTVTHLLGPEKAIVSSGGISPTEVNFKTMESRCVPNLYLVGDVLDINRPSGGYSLQLCWSTGYVAGTHVLHEKKNTT